LQKIGFTVLRQKGSHVILRRGSAGCVAPQHHELKIGTLSGVLKQAGVTRTSSCERSDRPVIHFSRHVTASLWLAIPKRPQPGRQALLHVMLGT
jgi:predicted RNA binding protein YcfA (HicA-like mRNA interferase family)